MFKNRIVKGKKYISSNSSLQKQIKRDPFASYAIYDMTKISKYRDSITEFFLAKWVKFRKISLYLNTYNCYAGNTIK